MCGSPASLPAWCKLCAGLSNPISAADPGPRDLKCLYQTSFLLLPVREQPVSVGAKVNNPVQKVTEASFILPESGNLTCNLIFTNIIFFVKVLCS